MGDSSDAASVRSVAPPKVIEWLLEEDQPSVRYLTLKTLLGRSESDPEVRQAKLQIPRIGWAAEILSERRSGGYWVDGERLYVPKYLSTNWKLLVLSDLGLTRAHPSIRESSYLWIDRFAKWDGGFGSDGASRSHLCLVGNTARALVKFGYEDHPKVRSALDWLVRNSNEKGGWSCWGMGRNLDSWEGLSAFAAVPRSRWTASQKDCIDRAAEFYLQRELHHQGDRYEPWYRFHYPVHYYYDVLVGLDLLTALGYADDPRLAFGIALLKKKRNRQGSWNLDAIHPDVEGPIAEWLRDHPKQRPVPFGLETPGRPSKIITLKALQILTRIGSAS